MLYFANPTGSWQVRETMLQGRIGFIDTPAQGNSRPPGVVWCADNGCFGSGYPGDDQWFDWLVRNRSDVGRCLFATAPDVVGDADASRTRSLPWLPKIRQIGYRAAYVAQNGETAATAPWDEFDVLFLGGVRECRPCRLTWRLEWGKPSRRQKCPQCGRVLNEWKLDSDAHALVREAKRRGKKAHMGRVNSDLRLRIAEEMGCDSVDGTYLTFGPNINLPKLISWLDAADQRGNTEPAPTPIPRGGIAVTDDLRIPAPAGARRTVVTASGPITHLCPFADETDEGEVTITWPVSDSTIELHSLAAYFDSFRGVQISHEELTGRIFTDLRPLSVTTRWKTAGMDVTVAREVQA